MNSSLCARAAAIFAVAFAASVAQLLSEGAGSGTLPFAVSFIPVEPRLVAILSLVGTGHFIALRDALILQREKHQEV